ncbi:MAG: hypothetical protein K6F34_10685 [Lachnospiraceae bacterium]|nr:hypothetical protein [Lachnospiraceae bacterium]
MRNKFFAAAIIAALALILPSQVKVSAATPDVNSTIIAQWNAAAVPVIGASYAQRPADQALLFALAANQQALAGQALGIYAGTAANGNYQAAYNMQALQNVLMAASEVKPLPGVDTKALYRQLGYNINTIEQARIAAVNARATANMTLTMFNEANALLNATKVEVATNPGLLQRLNELTVYTNSLKAQYDQQNADAAAKEANYNKLRATLPTDGYFRGYYAYFY